MSKKVLTDDEFMDALGDVTQPTKGKKSARFSDPMQGITGATVAKASGKNTDPRGRIRKTIFLPPETIAEIDETVRRDGYGSKMDFYHWLVAEGWGAYKSGKRPPTENVTTQRDIKL